MFGDVEAHLDEVAHLKGTEIQKLQFVHAFFDLYIFGPGQFVSAHAVVELVLVLDIALSEHESSIGREVELEEGVAALSLALEDIPALHLPDHQRLFYFVIGIDEVVVLEEQV